MFADSCEDLRQRAADRAGAVVELYRHKFLGEKASHAPPSNACESEWDDSLAQRLGVLDFALYPLGLQRVTTYEDQEVINVLDLFPYYRRQWITAGYPLGIRPGFHPQIAQRLPQLADNRVILGRM